MNRRQWLYRAGLAAGAASVAGAQPKLNDVHDEKPDPQSNSRLPLEEYEPKSMLHVHESYVPRARFATIDIHTHISFAKKSEKGVGLSAERQYLGTPQEPCPLPLYSRFLGLEQVPW